MGVRCGAFSSDSSLVITGGDSDEHDEPAGSLELWDALSGGHRRTLLQGENEILRCAFMPGDRRVFASTGGGYVAVPAFYSVDVTDGSAFVVMNDYVPVWVLDTEAGRLCIVDSRETKGTVAIVDTDTWQTSDTFEGEADCILDSKRGVLVTGEDGNRVSVIDLLSGGWRRLEPGFTTPLESLHYSHDGRFVVALSEGAFEDGELVREL